MDTIPEPSPSSGTTGTDSRCIDSVEIPTTDQVAQVLIKGQMADLTDAIREAVQNKIDTPGSSRVLVSVTPEHTVVCDDRAGVDLAADRARRHQTDDAAGALPPLCAGARWQELRDVIV